MPRESLTPIDGAHAHRQPVTGSSNVVSIGYDPKTETLEIEFPSGVYRYAGVPAQVHQDLMDADSKGKFIAEFIRGKYPFTRAI